MSPLIGSRASFTNRTYPTAEICSECDKSHPAGHAWLVSIRNGRVQKRVCSEDCRFMFDHKYWRSLSIKPEEELCEDEGCPHHGMPHICNPRRVIVRRA